MTRFDKQGGVIFADYLFKVEANGDIVFDSELKISNLQGASNLIKPYEPYILKVDEDGLVTLERVIIEEYHAA